MTTVETNTETGAESNTETHKETMSFQTEVKQLLQLMINSLYSNKEIFLRELVSNASDACDKLRFNGLTDDALYEGDNDLRIHVSFNKDEKTLTVSDNGIGMTREEVISNIGTIAKSGTKQFFDALTGDQAKDAQLIGQFGVGFYSSFIVAEKVTVITRLAGLGAEHGVRWESSGEGEFSLETIEKKTRGTEVILTLKADEEEFLDNFRLKSIIRRYSDHIALPILMESDDEEKKGEDERVNQASALWTRPKKEITDEEYSEFYKHVSHDFEEPLANIHTSVEGKHSYKSLFFIPKRAPFDLWDRERKQGIKLYVKRVFIMDDAQHILPEYLRFVKGIVDSDDLPLNISREILQKNRHIDAIRGASIKKILGLMEGIAKNDKEKYEILWEQFGNVLKEGPAEDFANKERIAKLLRFASTHSNAEKQNVSLEEYAARMNDQQESIYYISADNYTSAKNSPHLEVFKKNNIEVLLLVDRVDEWLMSHLSEFDGKKIQSVAKGDLNLGKIEDDEAIKEQEKAAEEIQGLSERMKAALGEKVKEVRITHRLTDSPSCLVVEDEDMAVNLQRMLKAAGHEVPSNQPIMEINPQHPLVKRIDKEVDEDLFNDWTSILFDQANLAEGGQLDDPASYVAKLNELLLQLSTDHAIE